MPRVIGSRRRTRVPAATPHIGRSIDSERGRHRPVVRGPGMPSARTILTVVGIGLGASLIFGSLAVGRGVERSIERTVEASFGRSDFRVSAPDDGTLSDELLVTIGSVLGVEVAAPSVELPAMLLPESELAAPSGSPVTIHGIDPILDGQIHDLDLVAGDTITRPDEAAAIITERLAAEDGYGLGSDVIVATPSAPERFRVIGIAAGDGPFRGSDGRSVILPIEAVRRLFAIDGVARVDLLVAEGVPVAGVRAELGEVLAGEHYVLTSPADLSEALQLPTRGFAVTLTGLAAVGILAGAVLVFGALRLAARDADKKPLARRVRGSATLGAVGAVVGASVALIAGALTGSDLAPAALGLGEIVAAIGFTVLAAVAAAASPLERATASPAPMLVSLATRLAGVAEKAMPRSLRADTRIARTVLEGHSGGSAWTVLVIATALGLVVAVAMVGRSVRIAAAGQPSAPVVARVSAEIDALWLLAVFVAGLAIVGTAALARPPSGHVGRVTLLEAGILGLAGAVLGSTVGLAVGVALILLGGGSLNPVADVPWAALALCVVLGVGLSVAAAWFSRRLAGRLSLVRAGQFG